MLNFINQKITIFKKDKKRYFLILSFIILLLLFCFILFFNNNLNDKINETDGVYTTVLFRGKISSKSIIEIENNSSSNLNFVLNKKSLFGDNIVLTNTILSNSYINETMPIDFLGLYYVSLYNDDGIPIEGNFTLK